MVEHYTASALFVLLSGGLDSNMFQALRKRSQASRRNEPGLMGSIQAGVVKADVT